MTESAALGLLIALTVLSVFLRKNILRYAALAFYFIFFILIMKRILSLEYYLAMFEGGFTLSVFPVFALFILIISFFRKRPYCFTLCPVGFLSEKACLLKCKKIRTKEYPYLKFAFLAAACILYIMGLRYLLVFPFLYLTPPYTLFRIIFISAFAAILIFFPFIWCNAFCPLGTFFDILYRSAQGVKRLFKK